MKGALIVAQYIEAPKVPLSYGPNIGGLALGGALREADLMAKPCKRKK
jgi:hypothetical protein